MRIAFDLAPYCSGVDSQDEQLDVLPSPKIVQDSIEAAAQDGAKAAYGEQDVGAGKDRRVSEEASRHQKDRQDGHDRAHRDATGRRPDNLRD
jgi:hypothetical protein